MAPTLGNAKAPSRPSRAAAARFMDVRLAGRPSRAELSLRPVLHHAAVLSPLPASNPEVASSLESALILRIASRLSNESRRLSASRLSGGYRLSKARGSKIASRSNESRHPNASRLSGGYSLASV